MSPMPLQPPPFSGESIDVNIPHPPPNVMPSPGPNNLNDKMFIATQVDILKNPPLDKVPAKYVKDLAHQRLLYLYYCLASRYSQAPTFTARLTPNDPPQDTTPPFVVHLLTRIINYLENQSITDLEDRFLLAYDKLDSYYGLADTPPDQGPNPNEGDEAPPFSYDAP